MSIEVLPIGITCQLKCTYCYQTSLREADPVHRYNRDAIFAVLEKLEGRWSLFGGEALILPINDIDELLAAGFKKWGSTGIQTNGALMTDAHIDLFDKYRTMVGISLDGPDELNDSRWAGTIEATRKQTERTHWAINRLIQRSQTTPHLLPSLIITLHAGNCSTERFPRFVEWIRELDAKGIKYINLHVMELDGKANELYLSQDEVSDRLIDLWRLSDELTNVQFTKFPEILKLLQGRDDVNCTWRTCDPKNTSAVQAVEHDGTASLCSRTFKEGKRWLPSEGSGFKAPLIGHPGTRHHERQLALYVTPQEHGGCKDCPYWMMCYGQCPGEGENNDWRMRSHYCLTWKKLFAEGARRLRAVGVKPLCDWDNRVQLEQIMYDMWVREQPTSLGEVLKLKNVSKHVVPVENGFHGDHTDAK